MGALTGSSIATGAGVNAPLLTRVILLGLAAPLVAAVLAFSLSHVPLHATAKLPPRLLLTIYRGITFPILAVTYAMNGAQKMVFAAALAAGVGVDQAAGMPLLLIITSTIFLAGLVTGLRGSSLFVRHGVTPVSPPDLLWTEVSTAIAVTGGSLVGIPLSMTQAITGGLLGAGFAKSARAVNWLSVRRIGVAWLWTLPLAGLVAYSATTLTSSVR